MSLVNSRRRSAAQMAASRANGKKSCGPCTLEGKARSSLNGFRHGMDTTKLIPTLAKAGRGLDEFNGLYTALYRALLPASDKELKNLKRIAIHVWVMKRNMEREVRSHVEQEEDLAKRSGHLPPPWQMRIQRPGWRVTISVWTRRGRGATGSRMIAPGYAWQEGLGWLHVGVTVTASMRHPVLGYPSLEAVPPGVAPRVVLPTKLKTIRKQTVYPGVFPNPELPPTSEQVTGDGGKGDEKREQTTGHRGQQIEEGTRNGSRAEANRRTVPSIPKIHRKQRTYGDVIPDPELHDMESWLEGVVSRWEKQHGPIPAKREVMPHETG